MRAKPLLMFKIKFNIQLSHIYSMKPLKYNQKLLGGNLM